MRTLADCAPRHAANIRAIAVASGEQPEAVYEKWREYSRDCQNFDQSPVLFEFCQWYGYADPRKDGEI